MRIFSTLAGAAVVIAALIFIAGCAGMLKGQTPADLGLQGGGKLKPPSHTDNSVSSQADLYPDHPQRSYAQIAPIRYSGDGTAAMARLADLLAGWPRTTLVVREPAYLRAECRTRLLQFTDDVEFALDPTARVIHVRSASRIGRKDFGVNRERVEQIRAAFKG